MEQSPWEADGYLAGQQIPRLFRTRRYITMITKSLQVKN
jgi:hypothetical protein